MFPREDANLDNFLRKRGVVDNITCQLNEDCYLFSTKMQLSQGFLGHSMCTQYTSCFQEKDSSHVSYNDCVKFRHRIL